MKLPVKWMAPKSLFKGTFSKKSDVVRQVDTHFEHYEDRYISYPMQWSYGVTCWGIFTILAQFHTQDYTHAMTLAQDLSNGLRLYKPDNTACSEQMYVNCHDRTFWLVIKSYYWCMGFH